MEYNNNKTYKLVIEGFDDEIIVSDLDKNVIFEELQDQLGDTLRELVDDAPVHDKIVGQYFDWDVFEEIYAYLKSKYNNLSVSVFDENGKLIASYPQGDFISEFLADRYFIDENGDIEVGTIWSCQLQNFIDNASWQYGLETKDGSVLTNVEEWPQALIDEDGRIIWMRDNQELNPIMWYGITGKERLDLWTIDESGNLPATVPVEEGMGSYGGQLEIEGLELNYPSLYDECMLTWYFGCGGNEGADFQKVIETFPLKSFDYKEEGAVNSKVAKFMYQLQTKDFCK